MSSTYSRMHDERMGIMNWRNLRRVDLVLITLVCVLAFAGIVTLVSASRGFSTGGVPIYLKQMGFFTGGVFVALFIACLDHRFLVSLAPLFYAVVLILLLFVLRAEEVNGVRRWLVLGPFRMQPSEQSKLALVFMLAWYLNLVGPRIRKFHYFLLAFPIAIIPFILIVREPSLGTAAALIPILVVMLYVGGCKPWHLIAIFLIGLAAAPLAWNRLEEYQKDRIEAFIHLGEDPQGAGWHTTQSIITVGSGGLAGKGYLQGTQTYLKYLPEHHTDFIFSLVAEEWGFAGASVVVVLYMLLLLRALSFAQAGSERSGALLAVGIATLLSFHIFVNIGITIGILPVTGIPLPFLSYGGSFYLTTMMCVGVLLAIHVRRGTLAP